MACTSHEALPPSAVSPEAGKDLMVEAAGTLGKSAPWSQGEGDADAPAGAEHPANHAQGPTIREGGRAEEGKSPFSLPHPFPLSWLYTFFSRTLFHPRGH